VIRSVAMMIALFWTAPLATEAVEVAGRGAVDLAAFSCSDTPRSTIIQRICYDRQRNHLLVSVGGSYAEYCGLPAATFDAFASAPSMGQFYRSRIAAGGGWFDCDHAAVNRATPN
jgi:KTSC domain